MFKKTEIPPEEEERRLEALYSYDILGEGLEHELDNLVTLAAQIANVPMAYISFVDRDEVILKSTVGLQADLKKLPRRITICQYTMLYPDIFIVPNVAEEPNFSFNPDLTRGLLVNF